MILARYAELRAFFAAPGALTAADGFPVWPGPWLPATGNQPYDNTGATGLLRANGFSGTIVATTQGGFTFATSPIGPIVDPTKIPGGDNFWPLQVTCNAGAADASPPAHDYDVYLSQRRDPGLYPVVGGGTKHWSTPLFDVTLVGKKSGTISINLNMAPAALVVPGVFGPALLTQTNLVRLFNRVSLYWSRRSDRAYQCVRFV